MTRRCSRGQRMTKPNAALATLRAERVAQHAKVAEETGYPPHTVAWISGAITFVTCYRRKGATTWHVSAAQLCRMLIADLKPRSPGHVRMMLEGLAIESSRDVGKIVYALIDVGGCTASESDSQADFDGVFERDRIAEFIQHTGLARQRDIPATLKALVVYTFYAIGALLIVMERGRNGYLIGLAAVVAGWLISKSRYGRPMRFGMPWSELESRTISKPSGDAA